MVDQNTSSHVGGTSDSKPNNKVTVSDDEKEVEKYRNEILTKLADIIEERVKVSKIALNKWKKPDLSCHLKVEVSDIGRLFRVSRTTMDMDELRLIHDEYRWEMRKYGRHKELIKKLKNFDCSEIQHLLAACKLEKVSNTARAGLKSLKPDDNQREIIRAQRT